MDQNDLKRMVADEAVKYVKDGMTVGLGSGTTVRYMVDALGKRVKEEDLKILCASTSKYTENQAKNLGIKVASIDDINQLDLTIDGADEISDNLDGIKGGGAAHLWEKIVAINSKHNLWIVDKSKMVHDLGKFPLPVEVIPFGSRHIFDKFKSKGYSPEFRVKDGKYVLTDSNNHIIDLHLNKINNPMKLADEIIKMVGVVEHGLFLNVADFVIVGSDDGISKITRSGKDFDQEMNDL